MWMSSWYNRQHTFGLKFIYMRWKLLPVALSTAQQAHLGDVLVPLLGAISLLHRTPDPTNHFRFGPHSTTYLSWQRRSNCWTPGPSHPSPYLICDLVQSSTDFSLCWCRHLFLHPCSTTTRTLRIFFPRDLKSLAMASSLLHLMKGSVMIMNPPWDVLGISTTQQDCPFISRAQELLTESGPIALHMPAKRALGTVLQLALKPWRSGATRQPFPTPLSCWQSVHCTSCSAFVQFGANFWQSLLLLAEEFMMTFLK